MNLKSLESVISFEQVCRGCLPASITTILVKPTENRVASYFIATLK